MQITLLAFARACDLLGHAEQTIEVAPGESPRQVLARVAPHLELTNLRVAVDREYRSWDEPLGVAGEIALIPPVSGG